MRTISARAWGKINLALAVGPPEPAGSAKPGWHRICSWFAPVLLHDELTLERLDDERSASAFAISWCEDAPVISPIDWPMEKDLCVRALRLLEQRVGRPLGVKMSLRKRIPVGGGMGGGSSDAASMLLAVDRLFDLKLGRDELRTLGAKLGSDVAFFIDDEIDAGVDEADDDEGDVDPIVADLRRAWDRPPRSAVVSGFGETIERVETPSEDVLLIVPGFGCPTQAVYKAFDAKPTARVDEERVRALVERAADEGAIPAMELFNDLAAPAAAVEPRLAEVMKRVLAPTQIPVYVSGSGSTLFVPFEVEEDDEAINRLADLAEQNLPREGPAAEFGVVAVPTRVV
ncbi:MAG: hypothetical protein IBJ18_00935 [Phycisphaerales bacterium]|nr:hypothetical protein [Phycisphaerales bacterium]